MHPFDSESIRYSNDSSTFNLILDFFLDQPLESHALRIKPEFNIIPEQRSQLENSIDSVLEADDFMKFSRLIEAVIEFHSKAFFRTCNVLPFSCKAKIPKVK